MSGTVPTWDRLRAPDHRRLVVGPIRRVEVGELAVVDGDLPEHGGATVFDAWNTAVGVHVRAAAVDGSEAVGYAITASRLVISGSDGRLEALLAGSGPMPAAGGPERLACSCRGVSLDLAYRTIAAGWNTVEAVKRATRIGFGPCQGRRCIGWLAQRLELEPGDPLAQMRPRPPLVPVPLSILAAFAEE